MRGVRLSSENAQDRQGLMFTLNELYLITGLAWYGDGTDSIDVLFHEQDGFTDRVTAYCRGWQYPLTLQSPCSTAHLPQVMTFKVRDLRALVYKLVQGYSRWDIVLPLRFGDDGMEVQAGPGRGTLVVDMSRGRSR